MGRTPEVSVVIPSFKRVELLKHGLRSLRQQSLRRDIEIIVVNDGIPDDGTAELCREYAATCIFTGQRNLTGLKWRCPGTAINIGVKKSLGSTLLLTVPEIYLTSNDVIEKLCVEVKHNNKCLAIPKGYDDTAGWFLRHIKAGNTYSNFNNHNTLVNLHTDYPFCMALAKKEYEDVCGYDESFAYGLAYDDTDFCRRLTNNGCEYKRMYDLSVIHLFHERERPGMVNAHELFERNKNRYLANSQNILCNEGKEWGKLVE